MKQQSKIKRWWLALLLSLCMFLLPAGTQVSASVQSTWDPMSTSKTATALRNNRSNVTLTVGTSSVRYDIVFVMDQSSCNNDVKTLMTEMLDSLDSRVSAINPDAEIKVGAVKFKGSATTVDFALKPLQSLGVQWDSYLQNENAGGSGTNMHAGLLAGKKMLDDDNGVPARNKFLVLISDAVTYLWSETVGEGHVSYGINFYEGGNDNYLTYAIPSVWKERYKSQLYVPDDWDAHLSAVSEKMEEVLRYASVYDRSNVKGKPAINYSTEAGSQLPTSVDVSFYKCNEVWTQMINAGYQTHAVTIPNSSHPFAASFVTNVLNKGEEESVSEILDKVLNRIDYKMVEKDSYVTDYMGYSGASDGTAYNFDFVNDANSLSMKVGQKTLTATSTGNNTYGFGALSGGKYEYELTYFPGEAGGEYFVWKFHVPVHSLKPIQLLYQVELKQAPPKVGEHKLYTNLSAVLTFYDTESTMQTRTFSRPDIVYTVEQQTVNIDVSKIWKDGGNYAGLRPDEITVELWANGAKTAKTLTLKASENWRGAFTGLEMEQNGREIAYTVQEVAVNGYQAAYAGDASRGFTITNYIQYAPPTGIVLDHLPWLISGAVSLLGIGALVIAGRRRREMHGARNEG